MVSYCFIFPIERILVEMEKLLEGPYRIKALQLLLESGLYQFLPSLLKDRETLAKTDSVANWRP